MNRWLRTFTVVAAAFACVAVALPAQAQETSAAVGPEVISAVRSDISPPLRDMPVLPLPASRGIIPLRPGAAIEPGTGGPDPVASEPAGLSPLGIKLNFDGQSADGVAPPDTNGTVGATQYVQWVNLVYNVYDKNTGTKLAGPLPGNQFWSGFGGLCGSHNDGDPNIQYDKVAGRWVAEQFAITGPSNSICIAVSTTSDALGSYARYEFNFGNQGPDYPKLGVWPDAYYVTSRTFVNFQNFAGAKSCAFDRTKMLAGLPATAICFQLNNTNDGLLPSDQDGLTPPPVGSPNFHIDQGDSTHLRFYKFHVDFAVPANSTFTGPINLAVAAYTPLCFSSCVPQPAPGEMLDGLGPFMMYRLAYRNFGTFESLLTNHSVNNGGVAGVRWYEIRDLSAPTPTVFQQGTIAVGNVHLWMGSIAQDKMGNIAVGFSASNNMAVKPSVAVTGRLPADPPGTMRTPHGLAIGTGVQQNTFHRWGDYSALIVDPLDDCTFWYTSEYIKSNGSFNWSTRISSFTFPSCQ